MEAVKLAPTLVPAAVLASKFESEAHQVRRSMRIVETAWLAQPHPDLADAYAHVKLGDSARQRLVRVETLAAKTPGHIEGALAIARAAIDASEFARAREALAPFIDRPTQRVALLMAEIERTEHGDSGRARAWTLARGARDARSRLDRRRLCQRPLAAGVAGHRTARCLPVADTRCEPAVRQGRRDRILSLRGRDAGRPAAEAGRGAGQGSGRAAARGFGGTAGRRPGRTPSGQRPAAQDNSPQPAAAAEPAPAAAAEPAAPPKPEPAPVVAAPLFRTRQDIPKAPPQNIPQVIPIVRAPDDPGVDEEAPTDEFSEQIAPPRAQAGGWRGFWSRWGS